MKKLIPLLLVVLTFAACEKDPDTDTNALVATITRILS